MLGPVWVAQSAWVHGEGQMVQGMDKLVNVIGCMAQGKWYRAWTNL